MGSAMLRLAPALSRSTASVLLALAASACSGAPAAPPPIIESPASAPPPPAPPPTAPPSAPPAASAPAPSIAPLFAPMFEANRTWKYQVTGAASSKKKGATRLTCRVAQLRSFAAGTVSRIVCTGDQKQPAGASEGPVGIYLVNDAGLWTLANRNLNEDLAKVSEADLASLRGEELILHDSPKAGTEKGTLAGRKENDGEDGSWGYARQITHEGEAWCSSTHLLGGEEMETSICLRAGAGPVRGTATNVTGVGPKLRWQEAP
jgi:hypothetical protein